MRFNMSKYFYNNKIHLLAFLISSCVLLFIYVLAGIWPFGERMILAMDLWGQYFPMLNNISSAIWDEGLLWSWKGGLGFNYIAQSAYYTNSPTFIIFALIPRTIGIYLINYLVLIKFGLSAVAFSALLKFKFKKTNSITAVFSALYALCAYSIAFISQTMWFDAVILLPLIIIGFEMLMEKKKPFLYCLTLFITAFSNFYIAYSICIFMFLYFLIYQISTAENKRIFIKQSISFSVFSILPIGASAFVLIPAYTAISKTLASALKYEGTLKLYHSANEFVDRLMPGTNASLEYGVPNLYCSVLVVLLAIVYIFCSDISFRKRLAFLVLTAFMLLSFNFNILNYIWHGFHYPNQLPGRQSFIFCLLMILMAYETIINIKSINKVKLLIGVLIGTAFVAALFFTDYDILPARIYITAALILLYAFLLYRLSIKELNYIKVLLIIIVITEVTASSAFMTARMPMSTNIKDYDKRLESTLSFANEFNPSANEFYRLESIPNFTFNPGQVSGYNGITYYSSTMPGTGYNFFKSLGFSVYAKNVSTIYKQTPVTNMMFGIKYLYDINCQNSCFGLQKITEEDQNIVYENIYTLPIAFVCDNDIMDYNANSYDEPLLAQNDFAKQAANISDNIFTRIVQVSETVDNANVVEYNDSTKSFYKTDPNTDAIFKYIYKAENDMDLVLDSSFKNGKVVIDINGKIVYSYDFKFSDIKYIGRIAKNDEITISVVNDKAYASYGLRLYSFNEDSFLKVYHGLSDETINIKEFRNTKIKGSISVKDDGVLLTTIPNDNGWSLKIDGKITDVHTVSGYLCAFNIEKGDHQLEFSYCPEGLLAGMSLSVLSVLILSVLLYIVKRNDSIIPCEA